jgi:excisionase family DNA binding protein
MGDVLTIDPTRMTEAEWLPAVQQYVRKALDAGEVVSIRSRPEFLSPAEAGQRLGMSRSTVTRKIESGEIRAIKVGSHHKIPLREFEAYRDRLVGDMIAATSDDIEADLYGE